MVRTDVQPGGSAEITLAPLDPGGISLWGTAYSVPCWQVGYGGSSSGGGSGTSGGTSGGAVDAGAGFPASNGNYATWAADAIYVSVVPGQTTPAELHFHQFGAVDVTVDFDNCGYTGSFYYGCNSYDGGPDVEVPDAGPDVLLPPEVDAGAASPGHP
jgi:hypothetical protein